MDSAWHRVRAHDMSIVGEMRQGRTRGTGNSLLKGWSGLEPLSPNRLPRATCLDAAHPQSTPEPVYVLLNSATITSS